MDPVLVGLSVLDLSWGISGPIAGMLLADNGAQVTKIEPPGGDPSRRLSGFQTWARGKRSAVLDLLDPGDRERFLALAGEADVLIEGFSPGTTRRLGIDFETISARNPRLVYCSISGYGQEGRHADRPAYDALVAARTGQHWEGRGIPGGSLNRVCRVQGMAPGVEAPEDCWVGAHREGPLFSGIPWPSIGAAYLATLAISAALRAREVTGRGQWVQTSLLQGALATTLFAWQRVEHPETPGYQNTMSDPRVPKGFFLCADGRWVHQWGPNPRFILGASKGDKLVAPPDTQGVRGGLGLVPEKIPEYYTVWGSLIEAFSCFTSDEWMQTGIEADVSVQRVRSPEEALLDPELLADGCVVEIVDPEIGPVRQVGQVYSLSACPTAIDRLAPRIGEHTAEVVAEADRLADRQAGRLGSGGSSGEGRILRAPLDGMIVLDLGVAVAGPMGAQLLADLGAEVIKISAVTDDFMTSSVFTMCHHGKRSVALDLKNPEGLAILYRMVERADVVHTNMRYNAVERLKVDYVSLQKVNPRLVYCHTRGHDKGPRVYVAGHDQSAACIAGTSWMEGATDNGGQPLWPVTSLGDVGNGLLSAIAVVQALYHRDRTAEGQFVDTAIVNAHLLNCSSAWVTADGTVTGDRPRLDAEQMGWNALYRLYATRRGWLCLAVTNDREWFDLCTALGGIGIELAADFPDAARRRDEDAALVVRLEGIFAKRPAQEWFAVLDTAGVPCEVSSNDFVMDLFDDPEMIEKGWVQSYQHPVLGKLDVAGLLFDFSETPGRIWGPPFLAGQHTCELLSEFGFDDEEIEAFLKNGVAFQATVP